MAGGGEWLCAPGDREGPATPGKMTGQSLNRKQHYSPSSPPSLILQCADGLPASRASGWVGMKALPSTGQHCPSVEGPALLPPGVAWSQAGGPQEKTPPWPLSLFPLPLPANRLPGLPSQHLTPHAREWQLRPGTLPLVDPKSNSTLAPCPLGTRGPSASLAFVPFIHCQ